MTDCRDDVLFIVHYEATDDKIQGYAKQIVMKFTGPILGFENAKMS
jgi:hypothetical protein